MAHEHYGALIRLQVAMTALQELLWASSDVAAYAQGLDPDVMADFNRARDMASAAIQIALGGQHEVPPWLMRNWRDNQMKRDAASVLAASAEGV